MKYLMQFFHTETNEWLVLYRASSYEFSDEAGSEVMFVRPYEMFAEKTIYENKEVLRFTKVDV